MWNQRYTDKEYIYGKAPNILVKEFIDQSEAGRILFAAEGEGRNAVYAAKHKWIVDAVDFSVEGKKKAMKLAKANHVQINYSVSDVMDYELVEDHYNAIALIYLHLHPSIREMVHKRMIKSLKTGGYILLMAFEKAQINNSTGGPKNLELLYNKEMLENDFNGLDFIKFEEKEVLLKEGLLHDGKSNNLILIAKKV